MSLPAPIAVIINTASGTHDEEKLRDKVSHLFKIGGIDAKISLAHGGAEVVELANCAAGGDSGVVVAGGGDGTVNTVASMLLETEKILGILPLGTLNHFARDLRIPFDLEGAVSTIVSGHSIRVDVGEVNGHIFLNNSSLGLYPNIVRERQKQQRLGHGKWPAFVWAALAVLRRYPFLDARLIAAGKEFEARTPFVFIGNNEYAMEGFNIGIRQRLDAGLLSVYMTVRTGRWELFRLALRALFRRLHKEKDFLSLTTAEAWIKTRHQRLRVAFDGEVEVMESPFHYRVLPHALRVVIPAEVVE